MSWQTAACTCPSDPEFFYHYGLFNYDFTPKPAAAAFTALAKANPDR